MKRIIPFLLILAACGKSADKPKEQTTPFVNPTVSITSSYEATAGGTRNGTGFDIKIDSATNFKRIAYIRLMNESSEVGVDAVVRPNAGKYVMFEYQHSYSTNTETYHLFVKLTDSTSFNSQQYKCH